MLKLPSSNPKKTKEILLIYGHHTSIERMIGVAEYLSRYGKVTIPDLPGFGGMDSFYKIGKKPSIDNMADYLASFIKFRYKNQRFTLIGMSYGFLVVTKMLQKYPELSVKVDLLCSMAGFVHKNDFRFKKLNFYGMKIGSWFFSRYLTAAFLKNFIFKDRMIRLGYKFIEPKFVGAEQTKIRQAEEEDRRKRIDFEIHLWKVNDARTYMFVGYDMFSANLLGQRVALPVYHVAADNDRYFDNVLVEQHMRTIFTDFKMLPIHPNAHATSVIATAKEAGEFFTPAIKALLRK